MGPLLAVETSCDETAVAVFDCADGARPLLRAELLSSQVDLHARYGGVVPELAAREHMRNLPLLIDEVLQRASMSVGDLKGLAVTQGPGLKGCLLIGLGVVKGLSLARGIPAVGVNHIEGHLIAPMLDNPELTFPYLALVVSGGHTEIQLVRAVGQYECLARTSDDAAGEAFDKSAALVGLAYPGGPRLAALADTVQSTRFKLPKVMREAEGFSFSGIKTAISMLVQKTPEVQTDETAKAELCFAVQEAIIDQLRFKLEEAVSKTGIRTVALTGGVAANRALRARLGSIAKLQLFMPSAQHCTDNAAMIGFVGAHRLAAGQTLAVDSNVYPRWPVEELSKIL